MSRLLISVLAFVVLFLGVVPSTMAASPAPAHAATTGNPWYSQSTLGWYAKVYGGDPLQMFGERYTAAQVQWVFYGVISMFINAIPIPAVQQCLIALGGGNATPCTLSLIQFKVADSGKNTSLFAAITEDRELSGITYVKDI